MATGTIKTTGFDGRYIRVTLEDGRVIKRKWNTGQDLGGLHGSEVRWSTWNPTQWSEDEWFNDIAIVNPTEKQSIFAKALGWIKG